MRSRRRGCLVLAAALLVGTAVLAALFEPTHVVRGYLKGEPFFKGRPTGYWRELLREDGNDGYVRTVISDQFRGDGEAVPVLRECAGDTDKNVRWPAVALLGRTRLRTPEVLDLLLAAVNDGDADVRNVALRALASWGAQARPAFSAIAVRLQDPELEVAYTADLALWRVDPPAAATATGWQRFESAEFGFTVMVPDKAQASKQQVLDGQAVAHVYQSGHRVGPHAAPTQYVVLVTEYPERLLKETTEDQRFEALKDSAPLLAGGKVVKETDASLGTLRGREYVLEVEGKGQVRTRAFWVGCRQYAAMVVYMPRFLNEPAATYFLDSFRLGVEHSPDHQAERPSRSR